VAEPLLNEVTEIEEEEQWTKKGTEQENNKDSRSLVPEYQKAVHPKGKDTRFYFVMSVRPSVKYPIARSTKVCRYIH